METEEEQVGEKGGRMVGEGMEEGRAGTICWMTK